MTHEAMTEAELDELDDHAAAAGRESGSEWRAGSVERFHVFTTTGATMGPDRVLLRMNEHFAHTKTADFIAAASPGVVRRLVAEVRRVKAERDAVIARIERIDDMARAAKKTSNDSRICTFCGCVTNAWKRRCCALGEAADSKPRGSR
jgi:hypothetical protein